MSSFHNNIAGLVHSFDKETAMQNFNSVSLEQCLEEISLNLSYFDSSSANIFSGDKANGDTFKGLFLAVNSLKILISIHNPGWLDDVIFTFFAIMFNFSTDYNVSGEFNDNLPSSVFSNIQDNI